MECADAGCKAVVGCNRPDGGCTGDVRVAAEPADGAARPRAVMTDKPLDGPIRSRRFLVGAHVPLVALFTGLSIAGGCAHDDAGGGAAPRDLSVDVSASDLTFYLDLGSPPRAFPCPPRCDGGECPRRCSGDAGGAPDVFPAWFRVEPFSLDGRWGEILSTCVANRGEGDAFSGVPVSFLLKGSGSFTGRIATVGTTATIPPGGGERVSYVWTEPPTSEGTCEAFVVVNGEADGGVTTPDCDQTDNVSEPVLWPLCGPG